jgi:hypothetical protein
VAAADRRRGPAQALTALKAIRTALHDLLATDAVTSALIAEELERESGDGVRDPKLLAEIKAKQGQRSG